MGATELIALAASFSLLAGWRLYAAVLVAGVAMRFDIIPLPEHLASLSVLGNPWVLAAAALGTIAEFLADKIAWVDSAWDTVHTLVRPLGGALLALAILDPADTHWQVITLLLGGGSALLTHGAKATTRAAVNASPEPVSNVVLSSAEDIATTSTLLVALANPWIALALTSLLLATTLAILLAFRRLARDVTSLLRPTKDPDAG
jgi:hypothetical protein